MKEHKPFHPIPRYTRATVILLIVIVCYAYVSSSRGGEGADVAEIQLEKAVVPASTKATPHVTIPLTPPPSNRTTRSPLPTTWLSDLLTAAALPWPMPPTIPSDPPPLMLLRKTAVPRVPRNFRSAVDQTKWAHYYLGTGLHRLVQSLGKRKKDEERGGVDPNAVSAVIEAYKTYYTTILTIVAIGKDAFINVHTVELNARYWTALHPTMSCHTYDRVPTGKFTSRGVFVCNPSLETRTLSQPFSMLCLPQTSGTASRTSCSHVGALTLLKWSSRRGTLFLMLTRRRRWPRKYTSFVASSD